MLIDASHGTYLFKSSKNSCGNDIQFYTLRAIKNGSVQYSTVFSWNGVSGIGYIIHTIKVNQKRAGDDSLDWLFFLEW